MGLKQKFEHCEALYMLIYAIVNFEKQNTYFPILSFVSLVLLSISGLRIALTSFNPLSSPFS